jgi:prolyl oligopeptidase
MVVDTLHGVVIADPYRWLEDQQSAETRAWIDSQNAYTKKVYAKYVGNLDNLKAELNRLRRVDWYTLPGMVGDKYFFTRRLTTDEQFSLCVRNGRNGKDSVLISPQMLSSNNTVTISTYQVSPDGTILSYGTQSGGEDERVWYFLNLTTGAYLPDTLPRARYFNVDLSPDKQTLYYTRFDTNQTSHIMAHRMGTAFSNDVRIYGENVPQGKQAAAGLSEDGRYLLIFVYEGSASKKIEVYMKDLASNGPVVPVVNDIEAKFDATAVDNWIFLKTNWNAPNWRVLRIDLRNPARENWKEVIPEQKDVLEGVSYLGGKLVASYLHNVSSMAVIYDTAGQKTGELISNANIGTLDSVSGRWDSPRIRYTFFSFNQPMTSYLYDLNTNEKSIWYQGPVAIAPDSVEVKQVWYPSKDGTKIPMFVVHKKGLQLDGARPTWLYGYGGFSQTATPFYSTNVAIWLSRGGVYAYPSLRGGGEFGEAWHEAAKFEKKQNTFDDFIAAGEWLIANKYTNSSKLAIHGGSNGGLLVGACEVQRPDLFQAVICTYPLLDMIRFQKLLVGAFWVSEYGSADSANQIGYIKAYSPYHNVKQGVDYPYTLFITGDADTRVAPAHARKMTAMLQSLSAGKRPIMLDYDVEAGHSGGEALSKSIDSQARTLGFLFWTLNVQ